MFLLLVIASNKVVSSTVSLTLSARMIPALKELKYLYLNEAERAS